MTPSNSVPVENPERNFRQTRSLLLQLAMCLFVGGVLAFSATRRAPASRTEPEPDLAAQAHQALERRKFRTLSAPLETLLNDPAYKPVPTQAHPLLGEPAPDFTLSDTDDKPVRLGELLGRSPVVLVFYYGYACDHCVSQLFAINKDLDRFRELDATVLAVSADAPDLTRKRFKADLLFQFKVTLLDIRPAIWRRIQVPDCTPGDLHEYIQAAFGWWNYHMHQFEIDGERYGAPAPDDMDFGLELRDETDVLLSTLVPKSGQRRHWMYEYDLGDG